MFKLYVKNMVCDRCKLVVKQVLEKVGMDYTAVELGEVVLPSKPLIKLLHQFQKDIEDFGFELIEDKNSRIISKIKGLALSFIDEHEGGENFSEVVTESLHKDYGSLSSLFSEVEGITIEKFLILQRVERVKELLVYDELSLGEIAHRLGYSSINHISAQFKKVTGLSPSHFKKIKAQKRQSLDKVGQQ